jgi:muconolactone delta-isomerase
MQNNKEKAHFEEKRKERERKRREGAWLYLWNLIIEFNIFSIFSFYNLWALN